MADRSEPIRLDRLTLYELVWSQPLTALAPKFGVSDVALGKLCKRLGVPRPPRGYWAKLLHGKTPKRPPLLPADVDGGGALGGRAESATPGESAPPHPLESLAYGRLSPKSPGDWS